MLLYWKKRQFFNRHNRDCHFYNCFKYRNRTTSPYRFEMVSDLPENDKYSSPTSRHLRIHGILSLKDTSTQYFTQFSFRLSHGTLYLHFGIPLLPAICIILWYKLKKLAYSFSMVSPKNSLHTSHS